MKKIAMLLAAGLAANGWSEETGAAFLKITPSVRGEALGGLNPAASRGAQALGVNPANLGDISGGYEFTSGFATMIGDSAYGTAGLAVRRSPTFTLGGSLTFLQSGSLEGRDAGGNATRDFNARDMAAGLSAAVGNGSFRAGATVKGVRQQIGEFKSNTAPALDAGLSFKTGRIGWGAAALNVGSGIDFRGRTEAFPAIYSLGASLPLGGGLTGLGSVGLIAGETVASMGLEYDLKALTLRAGYRSEGGENLAKNSQKSDTQALGGLTGGIGINVNNWRLDYAVSQTAVEYGMNHRAALTFQWGAAPGADRPAPKPAPSTKAPAKKQPAAGPGSSSSGNRAYDMSPTRKPAVKKKTWVH